MIKLRNTKSVDFVETVSSGSTLFHNVYGPVHDKTCNKPCATSEDSDQPAHTRSLIRVFGVRTCLLQPQSYPKSNEREPVSYWMDVQADLSLCWLRRFLCRFCRALAHMIWSAGLEGFMLTVLRSG